MFDAAEDEENNSTEVEDQSDPASYPKAGRNSYHERLNDPFIKTREALKTKAGEINKNNTSKADKFYPTQEPWEEAPPEEEIGKADFTTDQLIFPKTTAPKNLQNFQKTIASRNQEISFFNRKIDILKNEIIDQEKIYQSSYNRNEKENSRFLDLQEKIKEKNLEVIDIDSQIAQKKAERRDLFSLKTNLKTDSDYGNKNLKKISSQLTIAKDQIKRIRKNEEKILASLETAKLKKIELEKEVKILKVHKHREKAKIFTLLKQANDQANAILEEARKEVTSTKERIHRKANSILKKRKILAFEKAQTIIENAKKEAESILEIAKEEYLQKISETKKLFEETEAEYKRKNEDLKKILDKEYEKKSEAAKKNAELIRKEAILWSEKLTNEAKTHRQQTLKEALKSKLDIVKEAEEKRSKILHDARKKFSEMEEKSNKEVLSIQKDLEAFRTKSELEKKILKKRLSEEIEKISEKSSTDIKNIQEIYRKKRINIIEEYEYDKKYFNSQKEETIRSGEEIINKANLESEKIIRDSMELQENMEKEIHDHEKKWQDDFSHKKICLEKEVMSLKKMMIAEMKIKSDKEDSERKLLREQLDKELRNRRQDFEIYLQEKKQFYIKKIASWGKDQKKEIDNHFEKNYERISNILTDKMIEIIKENQNSNEITKLIPNMKKIIIETLNSVPKKSEIQTVQQRHRSKFSLLQSIFFRYCIVIIILLVGPGKISHLFQLGPKSPLSAKYLHRKLDFDSQKSTSPLHKNSTFKKTHTENLLFTENYIQSLKNPEFQISRKNKFKYFATKYLNFNSENTRFFLAIETSMLQQLINLAENTNPDNRKIKILTMRSIETRQVDDLKKILGSEKKFLKYWHFHEEHFKDKNYFPSR